MHTNHTVSTTSGIDRSFIASLRKSWPKKLTLLALPLVALVSFIVIGQTTAPSIPAVSLSADPLYTPSSVDKPALALALSVEFPTVGAQYVDPDNNNSGTTEDPTYSPTIEYLGYYDAESCYTYDDAGTLAPSGQASAYKRFIRRGKAHALSTANTANPTWTSSSTSSLPSPSETRSSKKFVGRFSRSWRRGRSQRVARTCRMTVSANWRTRSTCPISRTQFWMNTPRRQSEGDA